MAKNSSIAEVTFHCFFNAPPMYDEMLQIMSLNKTDTLINFWISRQRQLVKKRIAKFNSRVLVFEG